MLHAYWELTHSLNAVELADWELHWSKNTKPGHIQWWCVPLHIKQLHASWQHCTQCTRLQKKKKDQQWVTATQTNKYIYTHIVQRRAMRVSRVESIITSTQAYTYTSPWWLTLEAFWEQSKQNTGNDTHSQNGETHYDWEHGHFGLHLCREHVRIHGGKHSTVTRVYQHHNIIGSYITWPWTHLHVHS